MSIHIIELREDHLSANFQRNVCVSRQGPCQCLQWCQFTLRRKLNNEVARLEVDLGSGDDGWMMSVIDCSKKVLAVLVWNAYWRYPSSSRSSRFPMIRDSLSSTRINDYNMSS